VSGVDSKHEPVEKTTLLAGRAAEERVEVRRQPDDAHVLGEGGRGGRGDAVDAEGAARPAVRIGRAQADAEAVLAIGRLKARRDREGAGSGPACHLGQLGPAQAAPGREQRQRFQKVGLADAVLADKRHEPPPHGEVERRIGTEVLQDEAREARAAILLPVAGRGRGGACAAW
jgi:hypothetical protein